MTIALYLCVKNLCNLRNLWLKNKQQKGLTMMESIYLSIRYPLQQLIIGEPLANPYKKETQP